MGYQPPVADHMFLLRDVLRIEKYANLPGFADAPIDAVEQILEEAAKFTAGVLAPLNHVGDVEGCTWHADGSVTTPAGFKDAYRQMVEGGWPLLSADPAYGGQGLPSVVSLAFAEMSSSANMAFAMYPGLTHGAYAALRQGGSQALKDVYLAKMASFQWGGTMNLTEPQCGTDLGLIRTKAVRGADGTFRISGQKIWISGGEQDLTENIVHLVLARIEGAPAGVKGISLFLVPKFLPDEAGNPGVRNAVTCLGLEEKMGIHGNATCVMGYEDAVGWLVGEENQGLRVMFVMMNEARLGVGLQGVAVAEAAYQAALAFAHDRLQMRSISGAKNPGGPADPIIVHPDVRRLLLDQRAIIEGGRAFLLWTALHGDLAQANGDAAARERGEDYLALLTPVLKGFLTDRAFRACSDAVQVHGGSGFTEHFPVSQYLRDCRITMIYEGTNGIQALDLVGRKLAANGGRALTAFLGEMEAFAADNKDVAGMAPFVAGVTRAAEMLKEGTFWLMQNGMADPENAGAGSHDYMHLFGLAGLAFMWAQMAKAALGLLAGDPGHSVAKGKLEVGAYFVARVLPEAAAHLEKMKSGASVLMGVAM
jgi:alkylation response protein AidB-like acyl-CoA dehydrogenase